MAVESSTKLILNNYNDLQFFISISIAVKKQIKVIGTKICVL